MPFSLILVIGIFSVLLLLASAVMCIVSLVNSKKSGWVWLGLFFVSILGILLAFRMTFQKVQTKVNNFTESMSNGLVEVSDSLFSKFDSLKTRSYQNNANKQVVYLKQLSNDKANDNARDAFYGYYGFRDYYRYPLVYPYSLHCVDFIDDGALFDESDVAKFDENNNGEIDCNFNGIKEFDFTKDYLITRKQKKSGTKFNMEYTYYIYNFLSKEVNVYNAKQEFNKGLQQLKISKEIKFITVKDYSELF